MHDSSCTTVSSYSIHHSALQHMHARRKHTDAHYRGNLEMCWMNAMLFLSQYTVERKEKLQETFWTLKNWTWHLSNLVLKADGTEAQPRVQNHFAPHFCSFCHYRMFVGCQNTFSFPYLWTEGDRSSYQGNGCARICAGRWQGWRKRTNWQMKNLYF